MPITYKYRGLHRFIICVNQFYGSLWPNSINEWYCILFYIKKKCYILKWIREILWYLSPFVLLNNNSILNYCILGPLNLINGLWSFPPTILRALSLSLFFFLSFSFGVILCNRRLLLYREYILKNILSIFDRTSTIGKRFFISFH